MNAAEHEDLRNAEIARLTREEFDKQRAAIMAGDKCATTDACNSLADYSANSPDWPALVRTSLLAPGIVGKHFTDMLAKVMLADAEVVAIRQVEQAEASALSDPDNCRPTRRQRIAMDWREAGA